MACDGSNINPVALAILNAKLPGGQFAVPSPQVAVQSSSPGQLPVGQSTFAPPAHYREDQFTTDIDQTLSSKNMLTGRFFYSRATTTEAFSEDGPNLPGWGMNGLARNTIFVLADTHVFKPNLINIARFGYVRFDGLTASLSPLLASAIGEGTTTGQTGPTSAAPGLSINGLFTIGAPSIPSAWQVTNTYVWQDTVVLTHGRHFLRAGGEVKRHQVDEDQPEETSGLLQIATFDDFLLGLSAAQNGSPTGTSNVTGSQAGGGIFRRDERYTDLAAFVQDDVKLTPRLTVNAGLRYEVFGAPSDINGRLANFDPNIASGSVPAAGTFSGFTVPSNFESRNSAIPTGVTQTPFRGFWKTPYGDVSPRLGFVWQMAEKPVLVLRGGYGIYYDRHSGNIAEATLGQPRFRHCKSCRALPMAQRLCRVLSFLWCREIRAIRSSFRARRGQYRFFRGRTRTFATLRRRSTTSTCNMPLRRTMCCRWGMWGLDRCADRVRSSSIRHCWPARRIR